MIKTSVLIIIIAVSMFFGAVLAITDADIDEDGDK